MRFTRLVTSLHASKLADLLERFEARGTTMVGSSPEQFGQLLASETTKRAKAVALAGLRPE